MKFQKCPWCRTYVRRDVWTHRAVSHHFPYYSDLALLFALSDQIVYCNTDLFIQSAHQLRGYKIYISRLLFLKPQLHATAVSKQYFDIDKPPKSGYNRGFSTILKHVTSPLCPECPQGAPSLADRHAAVRPPSLLPQPQDPRTQLAHPRRKDRISNRRYLASY